ncbi:MAG: P1 family peptidase [Thermoplasmatales archaeon]
MKIREMRSDLLSGKTGRYNSITDVKGVKVGHSCVWTDEPHIQRTGATVIIPHSGDIFSEGVYAHTSVMNGFGILTGRDSINELGLLTSPVVLTNTRSVGMGYEAVMQYFQKVSRRDYDLPLPVVGECDDSYLNDYRGPPVPLEKFEEALKNAKSTNVEEGAVGAGTGMGLYDFKGGIGSSSRVININGRKYTLGVLLNANYGSRHQLSIFGRKPFASEESGPAKDGSCLGVLATDAPVTPEILGRLSRRMGLGLARTGSVANNSSGDIFIAFSTWNKVKMDPFSIDSVLIKGSGRNASNVELISRDDINRMFEATVDATEEAALNALFQAETTKGYDDHILEGFSKTRHVEKLGLF